MICQGIRYLNLVQLDLWISKYVIGSVFNLNSLTFGIIHCSQSTETQWESFTREALNDCEAIRQRSVQISALNHMLNDSFKIVFFFF